VLSLPTPIVSPGPKIGNPTVRPAGAQRLTWPAGAGCTAQAVSPAGAPLHPQLAHPPPQPRG